MEKPKLFVASEAVLREIYGKSSLETRMSEKRRDEVIAAAIFTSFRNQEFGTRFQLPGDYRHASEEDDKAGIDLVVSDATGRKKKLQIKGVHIRRSIERRKGHKTFGVAQVLGRKTQRLIRTDSAELTRTMREELKKIIQDYSGIYLLIYVSADLATQTSLQIAIKKKIMRFSRNSRPKKFGFFAMCPSA